MSDFVGRQIEAGVALEETRGTAETVAEKWFKKVNATVVERAQKVIDDATRGRLEDSDGSRVVRKWVEGDLEGIVHADAIGYLFLNLYGSVNTSTVSGQIKDHVFNVDQEVTHPSLTFFAKDGSAQQCTYSGAMVNTLELTATTDEYVRFTAAFMAREGASNADSPTYATTEYDFIGRDITVKMAASVAGLGAAQAIKAKSITITFDQGLIADHVFGQYGPQDVINTQMAITGEMTLNFTDTTYKDLFLADTAKVMQLVIEGAADLGSGNHPTITLLLYKVQVQDWNREGAASDLVTQTVSFKAFYSASDSKQSQLTLRNLTAEYDEPVSD